MHKKLIYTLIFASISIFSVACTETGAVTSKASTPNKSAFSFPIANAANYWYQGKAELSTYDVEQERYGEQQDPKRRRTRRRGDSLFHHDGLAILGAIQ